MEYAVSALPPCFIVSNSNSNSNEARVQLSITNNVYIPDYILVDANVLSYPLRLQSFVIEPVSIMLSVHTSVHLYVAFDHSPLYFEAFDRKNLIATPYRLGNALAMHYLSGAIFGIGKPAKYLNNV
jgi:vacuolar protein sorting-associated protein 13B